MNCPVNPAVQTGLENCLKTPPSALRDSRFGLLMNQASVDRDCRYACDLLARKFPGQLVKLFSPQHGLWGEQQANMIESPHGHYAPLGIPVYSLYSETRRPTKEMLADIDFLVIDLQDVGTRVYTFVWTMLECLRACAEHQVSVIVLDRPNPLGGMIAEGPMLEAEYRSFVGGHDIPLRHALTIGELAKLFNAEEGINADLTIVPMTGWKRAMLFTDTGLPWIPPSPNMPRLETAVLYPGQVLLEGTNLSEGRGTTTPFEIVGAPWLDQHKFHAAVTRFQLPGVNLLPVRFRPTFDKWMNQPCGGLAIHVTQPDAVRSVAMTMAIVAAAAQLGGEHFRWLDPPYEYDHIHQPIDILFGNDQLRLYDMGPEFGELPRISANGWFERCKRFLLY